MSCSTEDNRLLARITQQRAFTSTESQRASELYRLAARGKSKSGGASDIQQTRSSSSKRLHNRALPTRQPALSHRRGRGGAPHAQCIEHIDEIVRRAVLIAG